MKKVLVTGATGLIGKYSLKPLLDLGFEVYATSAKKSGMENGVNWINADLLDLAQIKEIFDSVKPEYLLHFAWDTTPGSYLESDLNYKWLDSSLEMLKQFKSNDGKRAVFAGTCFEYDFTDEPLNETKTPVNPKTTYAKCKNNLRISAEKFAKENVLSFGWGRIFYVFGEGENENRLVPKVIKKLSNSEEMNFSVGYLVKDYMFASDIASAFVKFLDSKVEGCVNICTSEPITIKELVMTIAKKLNATNLVKFEDKPSTEAKIIVGDNTRLKKEVGFIPEYPLSSALNKMIKSLTC
jgi:nucleoside-diphosphate-sugar epimerase